MIGLAALSLLGWAVPQASAALVVVDNVSPMITYNPPLYGDYAVDHWNANSAPNAWNTTFPQVKEWRPWDLHNITETHYTYVKVKSLSNYPTADISFVGVGIVLIGADSSYNDNIGSGFAKLRIDGKEQDCRSTGDATLLQCAIRGLKFGRHQLTVTVQEGTFAIGRFEIDTGKTEDVAPTAVIDLADDNKRVTYGGDYEVNVGGQWNGAIQSQNFDQSVTVKWNRAVSQANGTSISAKIPKGIGRVEVWGAVDVDHYDFAIEVDPPAYGLTRFHGNAYNLYTVQNMPMYETMLEPNTPHTIKVTNMYDAYLDISQFKVYAAHDDHSGSSSGLSAGAIAGIVVGVVVGLILLGLLLWFCLRRRRREKPDEDNRLDIGSDGGYEPNAPEVRPYRDSPPMSTSPVFQTPSGSAHMSYAPSASSAGYAGMGAYAGYGSSPSPRASYPVVPPGARTSYPARPTTYADYAAPTSPPVSQANYPAPTPPTPSHQSSSSASEPLLGMAPSQPIGPFAIHNRDLSDSGYAGSNSTVGVAALDAKVQPRPDTHLSPRRGSELAMTHSGSSGDVIVTEAPPVYNPEWARSDSSAAALTSDPSDVSSARDSNTAASGHNSGGAVAGGIGNVSMSHNEKAAPMRASGVPF